MNEINLVKIIMVIKLVFTQEEILEQYVRQTIDESLVRSKTVDSVERQVFKECEDSSGIHEDIDDSEPELRHKPLDLGDDQYFPEPEERSSHLDRKRNRVVRKLSLKKSKSNKSVAEVKSNDLPQNKSIFPLKDHKQVNTYLPKIAILPHFK